MLAGNRMAVRSRFLFCAAHESRPDGLCVFGVVAMPLPFPTVLETMDIAMRRPPGCAMIAAPIGVAQ